MYYTMKNVFLNQLATAVGSNHIPGHISMAGNTMKNFIGKKPQVLRRRSDGVEFVDKDRTLKFRFEEETNFEFYLCTGKLYVVVKNSHMVYMFESGKINEKLSGYKLKNCAETPEELRDFIKTTTHTTVSH